MILPFILDLDIIMTAETRYTEVEPFTTKDGSIIRELMHPTKETKD